MCAFVVLDLLSTHCDEPTCFGKILYLNPKNLRHIPSPCKCKYSWTTWRMSEIEATQKKFERALTLQSCAVGLWAWFGMFVERPESLVMLVAMLFVAWLTLATGRYALKCPKDRLNIVHQMFAALCTLLAFTVLFVVGMPSFKSARAQGLPHGHVSNYAVAGTALSGGVICFSVYATTCILKYGEAVNPLMTKRD